MQLSARNVVGDHSRSFCVVLLFCTFLLLHPDIISSLVQSEKRLARRFRQSVQSALLDPVTDSVANCDSQPEGTFRRHSRKPSKTARPAASSLLNDARTESVRTRTSRNLHTTHNNTNTCTPCFHSMQSNKRTGVLPLQRFETPELPGVTFDNFLSFVCKANTRQLCHWWMFWNNVPQSTLDPQDLRSWQEAVFLFVNL